jgi:hypothetical protein
VRLIHQQPSEVAFTPCQLQSLKISGKCAGIFTPKRYDSGDRASPKLQKRGRCGSAVRETFRPRVAEGPICNELQGAGQKPVKVFSGEQFKTWSEKIFLAFLTAMVH